MEHKGRTSGKRLIIGRHGPGLINTLWRLVADAQRDDTLAPVTVIAPSQYAGLALRQELGRKGFASVRFIVLSMLSELLGSAVLERQGRKPLKPATASLLLRRTLSQTTEPLAPVRGHPNTLSSVRAAFANLRHTEESTRAALAGIGGVTGEVAQLYDDFRKITADQWYGPEDLAEAAAETVNRGEAQGLLEDLGLIVFYLPRRTTPGEARLMDALASRGRCVVLLGTTGDDAADAATMELANRMQRTLGTSQVAGAVDESGLPAMLPGDAQLHTAPNAHEELRWVIRRIVQEMQNGVPLHRIAILYRMANPYASLIRDELRMAGIPMAGADPEPLANSAAGRTLRGLLALSDGRFERSDVMQWLAGCPVSPGDDFARDFSPSRWDAITRQAGIVRGLEQWRERLVAYAELMERNAHRRTHTGDISIAQADEMREEAWLAQNVLKFIQQLSVDLKSPPAGSSWKDFADWAARLLEAYLDKDINSTEVAALERIQEMLSGFPATEYVTDDSGLSVFRQIMDDLLQTEYGRLGTTGQGVFVSTFAAASGMDFDVVWLVGMIEGAVPPAIRPDPLLNAAQWMAAGGHDRAGARVAEERYEYLAAIASAPRRTLSYPVADIASQRPAFPSRWFLEQASALEGSLVHTGDLPGLHSRDWLTATESAQAGLNKADDAFLADGYDYRLKRLLQWRQDSRSLAGHPFSERNPLASAVRLADNRAAPLLTEFDGNLSAFTTGGRFGAGLRGTPVSATALETWATCPYRYFLGHTLGLRALNTPEEITEISALDRGSLLHEILERFMRESVSAGRLPLPSQPWQSTDRERLMNIAEEKFAGVEARRLSGKRLLWAITKETIRADLNTFLEEDARLRANHGTNTVEVETRFGFGRDHTSVMDEATGVRFRGFIDRIDVSADGASALVIDYKTGSATPYQGLADDPIDQGRHLQLGVYSLAVGRLYPHVGSIAAAYWFTTNRGGFKLTPDSYFDITDSDTAQRFRAGVASIVTGINAGLFPANPGPLDRGKPVNCRYCEFDALCPTGRSRLWARKKSDPNLAGYLELTGEGEATQQ